MLKIQPALLWMLLFGAKAAFSLELPPDAGGVWKLVAEGSLDSAAAAVVIGYYEEPLSVPRGAYLPFLKQWPIFIAGTIPAVEVLDRYQPWGPADIARFFAEYSAFADLAPILSFDGSRTETRAFIRGRIRTVGTDSSAECRLVIGAHRADLLSAAADCRIAPTVMRMSRRVVNMHAPHASLSVGNFTPQVPDPLLWGAFRSPVPKVFGEQSISDNILLGGTAGFNGIYCRYRCLERISAEGYYHRDAAMTGLHGSLGAGTDRVQMLCSVDRFASVSPVNADEWFISGTMKQNGALCRSMVSCVASHSGGVAVRGDFEGMVRKRSVFASFVWFSPEMRPVGSTWIGRLSHEKPDCAYLTLRMHDTVSGPIRVSAHCALDSDGKGERIRWGGAATASLPAHPRLEYSESRSVNASGTQEIGCGIRPSAGRFQFDFFSACVNNSGGRTIRYRAGCRTAFSAGSLNASTIWAVQGGTVKTTGGLLTYARASTGGDASVTASWSLEPAGNNARRFELIARVGVGSNDDDISRR